MSISLYQCSVLAYLQTLGAVHGFLQRGQDYCRDNDIDPQEIVTSRVHPDMLPFSYQVHSVAHHARATMEAIRHGVFRPPMKNPDCSYADLLEVISSATDELRKLNADEVNERHGAPVMFEMGELRLPFTAEDFVLSFSLPNFHFHATTAYDILRSKGVPLGKRDYLGRLRLDK
ncbi:MAG: DUF1993 domain-containing protein [Rhodanobacteraceae bacterium]